MNISFKNLRNELMIKIILKRAKESDISMFVSISKSNVEFKPSH